MGDYGTKTSDCRKLIVDDIRSSAIRRLCVRMSGLPSRLTPVILQIETKVEAEA